MIGWFFIYPKYNVFTLSGFVWHKEKLYFVTKRKCKYIIFRIKEAPTKKLNRIIFPHLILYLVRLQGGGSSGLLQVYHSGVWGTVCDDGWTSSNSLVVCRQLGFPGALSFTNQVGTGQIWLDDVACSGTETALRNCQHRGWGTHNCGHGEDLFIRCQGMCTDNLLVRARK